MKSIHFNSAKMGGITHVNRKSCLDERTRQPIIGFGTNSELSRQGVTQKRYLEKTVLERLRQEEGRLEGT